MNNVVNCLIVLAITVIYSYTFYILEAEEKRVNRRKRCQPNRPVEKMIPLTIFFFCIEDEPIGLDIHRRPEEGLIPAIIWGVPRRVKGLISLSDFSDYYNIKIKKYLEACNLYDFKYNASEDNANGAQISSLDYLDEDVKKYLIKNETKKSKHITSYDIDL